MARDTVVLYPYSDLNVNGVGQCKLKNENKNSYELKSCVYDYYEKSLPKGNAGTSVPYVLLLSLCVVITCSPVMNL